MEADRRAGAIKRPGTKFVVDPLVAELTIYDRYARIVRKANLAYKRLATSYCKWIMN